MNRQKQLLAVLLVLLTLSVVYAWNRTPRQQIAATPRQTSKSNATPAEPAKTTQTTTKTSAVPLAAYQSLALPEPEQTKVTVKKDLFIPLHVIEAKIAAKKAAAIKPPPPPPPPPPPTLHELARKELELYKPLGLLKKNGKLVAFLSKEGQIKLVRVGDSLIKGYKVTNIQDGTMIMHADDGDEMSLGLK